MIVSGIDELHNRLYEVLCTIDDICRRENIRYFLDSGTEIGAAREHDFIPWDDDMDIKVLSEDYQLFKNAMEKYLPPYMHIIEPHAFSPAFYDFTVRIIDERYRLHQETEKDKFYHNYQNYVGTDVFIFCKAPNSTLLRKKQLLQIKMLYGLGMAHRFAFHPEGKSKLELLEIKVLNLFGKRYSPAKICEKWYKLAFKYQSSKSEYRFPSNYQLKNIGLCFPERIYESEDSLHIRNRCFMVPALYDEELSIQYGNWKEPENSNKYIKHLDGNNG